tara:strand:+ start:404 stop:685 length:282 start_codon:yes stop_codon:yes gene_type:complete
MNASAMTVPSLSSVAAGGLSEDVVVVLSACVASAAAMSVATRLGGAFKVEVSSSIDEFFISQMSTPDWISAATATSAGAPGDDASPPLVVNLQ